MRDKTIHPTGIVEEAMPNLLFRVKMDDGQSVIAYKGGKLKLHKISVIVGDRVQVILDPYGGKASNRLIKRL
jgi:translation initiation factor IF-1